MTVTWALLLGTIKGEASATSREDPFKLDLTNQALKNTHPTKETWDLFPLSKACNPYYERFYARPHEQQQHPLDVGAFLPEPV
jgi:hypothetical protein